MNNKILSLMFCLLSFKLKSEEVIGVNHSELWSIDNISGIYHRIVVALRLFCDILKTKYGKVQTSFLSAIKLRTFLQKRNWNHLFH